MKKIANRAIGILLGLIMAAGLMPAEVLAESRSPVSDYNVNLYDYSYTDWSYTCGKNTTSYYCGKDTTTLQCGLTEHTHTSSCYSSAHEKEKVTATYASHPHLTYTYIKCKHCGKSLVKASDTITKTCPTCGATVKMPNYVLNTALANGTCSSPHLTCTKTEHTHSSSCYHTHTSACKHTHTSSCKSYYTSHTYYADTSASGTVIGSVSVKDVCSDPYSAHTGNLITLKTPTRTGYTFKGWYGSNGCTEDNPSMTNPSFYVSNGGNLEYTAKWEIIDYALNINPKGGKFSRTYPTTYTVEDDDIDIEDPVRKGCRFEGWNML